MAIGRQASISSRVEAAALAPLLETALQRLRPLASAREPGDGILFSGNRHESVPRALFTDSRLTPLERNAWQVFRMMLNDDGVTAFPTYEQLRPYLASMPCSGKASDETVARALTLLRLTRWLSLVRHRRDPETGRIQGNLYVLHDEPLTPYEAIQLDPHYLGLVSRALTHASKAVQHMGYHTLKEITDDPLLTGRVLPSRLQMLIQRVASHEWAQDTLTELARDTTSDDKNPTGPATVGAHQSHDDTRHGQRPPSAPSSESEVGGNTLKVGALRNPKKDRTVRTVRTDYINEDVRTEPRARADVHLRLPDSFVRLRPEQQAAASAALQHLEVTLQQAVLDEWAARCRASSVRNPAGYLFGIIQKAMRGDFHPSARPRAADRSDQAVPPAPAGAEVQTSASREVAQEHIAKLRAMMRIR